MHRRYSEAEIVHITGSLLKSYNENCGYRTIDAMKIDIMDIYDSVIYPEREIHLDMTSNLRTRNNRKVLGWTTRDETGAILIRIDVSIAPRTKDPRFPFTLAHELGHAWMHQDQQLYTTATSPSSINIIEGEANLFAKHLLMPRELVIYRFEQHYEMKKPFRITGPGEYYVNNKKMKITNLAQLALKLAKPLVPCFSNVSPTCLVRRLVEIGLIKIDLEQQKNHGQNFFNQ